jgi:hypothetical protein
VGFSLQSIRHSSRGWLFFSRFRALLTVLAALAALAGCNPIVRSILMGAPPRPCHFQPGRFSRASVLVAKLVAGLCAFANLSASHHQTNMPFLFYSAATSQRPSAMATGGFPMVGNWPDTQTWEPPARGRPHNPAGASDSKSANAICD